MNCRNFIKRATTLPGFPRPSYFGFRSAAELNRWMACLDAIFDDGPLKPGECFTFPETMPAGGWVATRTSTDADDG